VSRTPCRATRDATVYWVWRRTDGWQQRHQGVGLVAAECLGGAAVEIVAGSFIEGHTGALLGYVCWGRALRPASRSRTVSRVPRTGDGLDGRSRPLADLGQERPTPVLVVGSVGEG
jgi:hypothetical protein